MDCRKIKINDNGEPLEDLKGFPVEPVYFNMGIAPNSKVRLRKSVIAKLEKAKKMLPKGWNFKIFDGYRLLKTQKKLFNDLYNHYRKRNPHWDKDALCAATERFVAPARYDKKHPSPHNTGGAVDLTIIGKDGNELPMGTSFDEFSERAFTGYFTDGEFYKNRMFLKRVLEEAGFVNFENEWWHYSYGDQIWAFQKRKDYAIYGSVELK